MSTLRARDVMCPKLYKLRDTMSIQEAASFLTEHEISGAPVEDDDGNLVGLVSLSDIARFAAEEARIPVEEESRFDMSWWQDNLNPEDYADLHIERTGVAIAEIMTPTIYSVDAETSVGDVARHMLDGHLHRLLVTNDGKAVGIITTSDMLKVLVEED